MKYIEFDHPIIRGLLELYRGSGAWSMIGLTVVYIGIFLSIIAYIMTRRHHMTKRRWLYVIGSFVLMSALFLSSIMIPGHLKSGYYAGDVEVKQVVPITQTQNKQYGIIPKTPMKPRQIQGLITDKRIIKDKKIKKGDTLHIQTKPCYRPKSTTSYIVIKASDIKKVKRGH